MVIALCSCSFSLYLPVQNSQVALSIIDSRFEEILNGEVSSFWLDVLFYNCISFADDCQKHVLHIQCWDYYLRILTIPYLYFPKHILPRGQRKRRICMIESKLFPWVLQQLLWLWSWNLPRSFGKVCKRRRWFHWIPQSVQNEWNFSVLTIPVGPYIQCARIFLAFLPLPPCT